MGAGLLMTGALHIELKLFRHIYVAEFYLLGAVHSGIRIIIMCYFPNLVSSAGYW